MKLRALLVLAATALWVAAFGAYAWRHGQISTDITHFLSTMEEREMAAIALSLADSDRARTLILGITAPDETSAVAAARELADTLSAHPEVARLRAGPDAGDARAVFDLYFPRRFGMLSSRPEAELAAQFAPDGLAAAAQRLRSELALPQGALLERTAAADPLLAFPDQLRRLEAARGSLRVVGGGFVAGDPPRAILFVTTQHSAFDASHQAPLLDAIAAQFAALNARHGGALKLEQSGLHGFAVSSERAARRDAAWISTLSMIALLGAFLWIFRSPRVLAVTLIPLVVGVVTATAVTMELFGGLHALTVAFGSTLIGVCVDYPIHFMSHFALRRDGAGPHAVLRRVAPALALAVLTTVAGFLGIAASDLPGVREVGVFAALGVLAALAATALVVPELVPRDLAPTPTELRLADRLERLATPSPARRAIAFGVVALTLAVCAYGLTRLRFDDDVFALNLPLDAAQLRESQALADAVAQVDAGRMVVAIANDDEAALRANDAVAERLAAARDAGALDGFRSLHSFVWSRDLQQRNWDVIAAQPQLADSMLAALEAAGFRPDAFAPFATALRGPAPPPLTIDELLASPLAEAVAPHRVALDGGKVALLTLVRGVRDPVALTAAIEGIPGVRYFDNQTFVRALYARHRTRSIELVGIGTLAVVVLLLLRYRNVGRAIAAGAPGILGALAAIGVIAATGTPLNILHLLGLVLVLSLGADYGIFLAESDRDDPEDAASLLSVTLAALTTLFSFGLLSLSSFPALRALGVATAIGVAVSPALSLCFRLLRKKEPS